MDKRGIDIYINIFPVEERYPNVWRIKRMYKILKWLIGFRIYQCLKDTLNNNQ